MKLFKTLLIGFPLMLVLGCSSIQPKIVLPVQSSELSRECPKLKPIPYNATNVEVLEILINNNKNYINCKTQNKYWNEFYNQLRELK